MKRYGLLAVGWLLLAIAALTLFYQSANLFLAPPSYEATAAIRFSTDETIERNACEFIFQHSDFLYSTNVLYPVCDSLGLEEKFGKQYGFNHGIFSLNKNGVCLILKNTMFLSFYWKTENPVRVNFFSENPDESIQIANITASSLVEQLSQIKGTADIKYDAQIKKAIQACRSYPWAYFLIKILAIVFPCSVLGVVLICISRYAPPPIPMASKHDTPIISRY